MGYPGGSWPHWFGSVYKHWAERALDGLPRVSDGLPLGSMGLAPGSGGLGGVKGPEYGTLLDRNFQAYIPKTIPLSPLKAP